jgi:membrane protein implicated in regulation of membrane protease activity
MPEFLLQASAFTVFLGLTALGLVFLVLSLVMGELFDFMADAGLDGGPSFFSSRVLSVLVTAFGASGAIAIHLGLSTAAATAIASAGGFACGFLVYQFARFLYSQQATTEITAAGILGRSARVIVPIPPGGVGQIRIQSGEELIDKVARSRSGGPVAANSIVIVEEVLGEIVIVQPQPTEAPQ